MKNNKAVFSALSLSAPAYSLFLFEKNDFSLEIVDGYKQSFFNPKHYTQEQRLHGIATSDEYREKWEEFNWNIMRRYFYIYDSDDFKQSLETLLNGSDITHKYNRERNKMMLLSSAERDRFLCELERRQKLLEYEAFDDTENAVVHFLLNKYDHVVPQAGLLAFDISCYIMLSRLGLYNGLITEDELLEQIKEPTRLAQENYRDFFEFGLTAFIGVMIKNQNVSENAQKSVQERLKSLSSAKNSVWNRT